MNRVANNKEDFLQVFLDLLAKNGVSFCAIGGLAVNAYAEPVVSLDLDIVVVADQIDSLTSALQGRFLVKKFPNSINITEAGSDFRIQIQTDARYQPFIGRSVLKHVLGYAMPVASIEDLLQGKIWAATDEDRRASKRQKDLSDILRLTEMDKRLASLIPDSLKKKFL